MRLRTAADDLASILLVEIPRSLRLVVLVVCLLVTYATGLAWMVAAGYQTEVMRLEGQAEVRELRKQVEHLWGAFEYVKTTVDRVQLDGRPRPGKVSRVNAADGSTGDRGQPRGPQP